MFYALKRPVPQTNQTVIAILLLRSQFPSMRSRALAAGISVWLIRGTIPSAIGDLDVLDAEAVDQLNDLTGWRLYLRPRKSEANRVLSELIDTGYRKWCDIPGEALARFEVFVGPGPITEPLDFSKHIRLEPEKYYLGPPWIPRTWSSQDQTTAVPW